MQPRMRQKGFTVVEFSIAFGVAAVVLGGVWVAADVVHKNTVQQKANEQIMTVVQNVREYYGTRGTSLPDDHGTASFTQTIDGLDLIPKEMRTDPTKAGENLVYALSGPVAGGAFRVSVIGASRNVMRVQLLGLSKEKCIGLLNRTPVLSPEIGIVRIGTTNGNTTVDASNVKAPGNNLPLTTATMNTWCSSQGDTNEVDIDYKLRN